ncbi:MAG: class A beta-lactamase-related serine hydrolase [Alphaproteobacteria bacterium]|nr:class A beta-lactamase-related serine hydrolase [Alphaproteobacteria bacterium]MBU0863965.1 class A beta-lactamase-related serine hydrolase [Alphaproteobacteria bacterium]MBU1823729.1 class A beta-lactamase-related serine hydrolase [Alphaproteobacteria bacterium]
MTFELSARPLLAMTMSAAVLAGCVSSAAVVPTPRTQAAAPRPAVAPRPAGSVTVPIGQPVRSTMPRPAGPIDPGFRRPPAGLSERIHFLWRAFPGKTGIAVQRIDGEWAIAERGGELFPQQSVSKLWVSLTALDAVDQGRIRLDQQVRIGPEDLTLFYQPLAARVRAQGSVTMTVRQLIETAITQSDNSANDSLLRTVGGPGAVRAYLSKKDLGAIRFGPGERLLQSGIAGMGWQQSYSVGRNFEAARSALSPATRRAAMDNYLANPIDGASPTAVASALTRLARGTLLSPESTEYLLDVMSRTKSGPKRLKAGLPPGWKFLHKTGTGQNLGGMTAGYNDIGIATAPDGTRYAIVVFMGTTTSPIPARMALMQAVSSAVAEFHGR